MNSVGGLELILGFSMYGDGCVGVYIKASVVGRQVLHHPEPKRKRACQTYQPYKLRLCGSVRSVMQSREGPSVQSESREGPGVQSESRK